MRARPVAKRAPSADRTPSRSLPPAPKRRRRRPHRAPEPQVLEKFVVWRILRKRLLAGGAPEYHTLWEGYPAAEATWEPAESFAGCKELLDAFEQG